MSNCARRTVLVVFRIASKLDEQTLPAVKARRSLNLGVRFRLAAQNGPYGPFWALFGQGHRRGHRLARAGQNLGQIWRVWLGWGHFGTIWVGLIWFQANLGPIWGLGRRPAKIGPNLGPKFGSTCLECSLWGNFRSHFGGKKGEIWELWVW